MQQADIEPDLVIDINPSKQGRFLAKSGLLVSTPGQALQAMATGDRVFVMNSNYRDEIIAMSANRYNYITVDHE